MIFVCRLVSDINFGFCGNFICVLCCGDFIEEVIYFDVIKREEIKELAFLYS